MTNTVLPNIQITEQPKKIKVFVYIIANLDNEKKHCAPIKIGVTANCETRLKDLQCGNPRQLDFYAIFPFKEEVDAYLAEKELHELFAEQRLSGEWFNVSPEVIIPELILTANWRWKKLREDEVSTGERIWSWIQITEWQSYVIEQFIKLHKNGCELYRKFNTQARVEMPQTASPREWQKATGYLTYKEITKL